MDLTIKKLTEKNKKLQELVDYYENLIALMPGHVYWVNKEGIYQGCNNNQAKSAGLSSRAEIVGKKNKDLPWNLGGGMLPEILDKVNQEVMRTGKSIVLEEPAPLFRDGIKQVFLTTKTPIFDQGGEVTGVLGISIDITELRRQEISEYLENIISLLPGHVYWKNKEGVFLGCNDSQAKSAGFTSSREMIGKTDFDMPWKDQAEILRKIDLEVMRTRIPHTVEEPSTLVDGTEAVFLSKKAPFYYRGEIVGVLGISFDITEQRKAEKELRETQDKLEGMTLVSASMAHELRTPLAGLNIGVSVLKDVVPQLVEVYQSAKEAKLPVPNFRSNFADLLLQSIDSMQREVGASLTFIDMMLMNLKPEIKRDKTKSFSINQCVDETLSRYPFFPGQEKLVHWEKKKEQDFKVTGDNLLVTHVLFNLLKNAIYYITKAKKGNISIQLSEHKLYFKDTGVGISSDFLPHIFDRFFSKTHHGAGVGLTFCKMVMENLGGSIVCESVEGDYTLFILSFPE